MSLSAYVKLRGVLAEKLVTYDLGPVRVDHTESRDWYRNTGFNPMPTAISGSASKAQLGDGVNGTGGDTGTFAQWNSGGTATIAVPDEMADVAPRTLSYTTTYLTFYANTLTAKTFTTNFAGDANQMTTATAHGLSNGDQVTVSSTTTLPAGLTASTRYYVVNATSTTVELALSAGGTPITLTSDGSGTHSLQALQVAGEFPINRVEGWSNGQSTLIG